MNSSTAYRPALDFDLDLIFCHTLRSKVSQSVLVGLVNDR